MVLLFVYLLDILFSTIVRDQFFQSETEANRKEPNIRPNPKKNETFKIYYVLCQTENYYNYNFREPTVHFGPH